MAILTGRKKELEELKRLYCSGKSELVAVYGRRRVGKTFLVDEAYKGLITFRHAGLSPVDEKGKANMLADQLQHFYQSLILQGMKKVIDLIPGLKLSLCWNNGFSRLTMAAGR